MYGFYDPEAVIQDADIEMWEMQQDALEVEANCKAGEHRLDGEVYCIYCGS